MTHCAKELLLKTLFQGPALYAYNNAVFTEDDWENICMIHQSSKETDPMKVGRYGLGFKSVFHLTGEHQKFIFCLFI